MEFNIKLLFVITSMVLNFNAAAKEKISLLAPYDEWYFNFFYPNSLPAEVTYVELLDTDGIYYQFRTLASTNASPGSVGQWSEKVSGMSSVFNKAKNPPMSIHFCWDSVIDKKVYETWITLAGDVWKLMLTPYSPPGGGSEKYYLRYLLIGLAPEGKIGVWLEKPDKPNAWGQQGDPASVSFRIAAPAAPVTIELIPGYFQITAVPKLAVYDPTVQFEFWFSEKRIIDIRQVETSARYLGTALYWIAASSNIKPGYDYYFYIRSVNTVGKSAFVEAVGRASDDAEGYLNFYKGLINKTHLGKELLENFELTEDNASKLEEFSKEWKDANDKWNAMWGVKIEQTKDGKHYVAGLGLSMEDTEEGKLSQFLVAANRIAFIDPANGNETPMFVAQGNQIFMNDVFLKRLTAPTITSGGNPPAFSLTPDGRLTAKNADISGNVNANSGTLNNVTINENCRVLGKLSANQIEGDLVKTVGKAFPRDSRAPERWPSGTITVRVYDDQPFDRQIVIPAVAFSGAKHEREHTDIYSSCRLIVRKNGAEIYNRTALDNTLIYSGVIDMPAGHGHMTLEFSVSAWLVNGWYPTASISDLLVVVMKKATAGITIS